MGKVISQTPPQETVQAFEFEIREGLYVEAQGNDAQADPINTPVYDDEIGLWEELESRGKRTGGLLNLPASSISVKSSPHITLASA